MKRPSWVIGGVVLVGLIVTLACGLPVTTNETVVTAVVVVTNTPAAFEPTATSPGAIEDATPQEDEMVPGLPYNVPVGCPIPFSDEERLLIDEEDGYCLLYPADFTHESDGPGTNTFLGPPLTSGNEPLMAAMFIKVEAANGRTIEQVEDEIEATYSDLTLTITPATLGGQPAIMVVGEPGRSDSRKIYVVNSDRLYTVTVTPYEDFAETRSYADAILQLTLDTFWFIGN